MQYLVQGPRADRGVRCPVAQKGGRENQFYLKRNSQSAVGKEALNHILKSNSNALRDANLLRCVDVGVLE